MNVLDGSEREMNKRQNNMELDYFLLENKFDFQFSKYSHWSFMELAIRVSVMQKMSNWFSEEQFDPHADFILSYCSGDLQYHVSRLIADFMEGWVK